MMYFNILLNQIKAFKIEIQTNVIAQSIVAPIIITQK